jgi:hypothetical protein
MCSATSRDNGRRNYKTRNLVQCNSAFNSATTERLSQLECTYGSLDNISLQLGNAQQRQSAGLWNVWTVMRWGHGLWGTGQNKWLSFKNKNEEVKDIKTY